MNCDFAESGNKVQDSFCVGQRVMLCELLLALTSALEPLAGLGMQ